MAQAPATVLQEINALYIALYGRAADANGISFWISTLQAHDPAINATNAATTAVSQGDATFLGQQFVLTQATVFTGLYGALNDVAFVEALYKNIGGNAGDAAGIQFWLAALTAAEAGGQTVQNARAGIVGQFVQGIMSIDLTNQAATGLSVADFNAAVARQNELLNRVTVSQFYADQSGLPGGGILTGAGSPVAEADVIASVTQDGTTVGLAKTAISAAVAGASLQPILNLVVPAFKNTITLTVDQDTFNTGTGNDLYLAPIGGLFGGQNTLTSFDTLIDGGQNNALQAFFAAGGTIAGATIQGIQSWQFSNSSGGAVNINGGLTVGGPGPNGLPNNGGVTNITIQNSTGGVTVGGLGGGAVAGQGIQSVIQSLTLFNNAGTAAAKVFIAAGKFTGTDALTLNVNNVGNGEAITVAPNSGVVGYQTWNVVAQDTTGDDIALSQGTATSATTINLTDAAATLAAPAATAGLILTSAGGAGWAKVATINGSAMTGAVVISGGEGLGNAAHYPAGTSGGGLLAGGGTALTTISGGGGNDFFDLTAFGQAAIQAMTITGGAGTNEADIAWGVASSATLAPLTLMTQEQTVGLAGVNAGTLNDANFPGVTTFLVLDGTGQQTTAAHATLTGALAVTHAASGLTIGFGSTNLGANTFTITDASTTSTTDSVFLDFGQSVANGTAAITTNGFATVNLVTTTLGGLQELAIGSTFTANPNPGAGITLNVSGIGNLDLTADVGSTTVPGTATVITAHGAIHDTEVGWFDMGITDAVLIDASGSPGLVGNGLFMEGPGSSLNITVKGAGVISINELQGSLGPVTVFASGDTGAVGNDNITSNGTGDIIYGDGGNDAITLNGTADHVVIGAFETNLVHSAIAGTVLQITNNPGMFANTFDTSTTTITGFIAGSGATHDFLELRVAAWGHSGTYDGLINGADGHLTNASPVNVQNVNSAGDTLFAATSVVADGIAVYANAAALFTGLTSINGFFLAGGPGAVTVAAGHTADFLVAYATATGVNIADVTISGGTTGAVGTAAGVGHDGAAVVAHDLVTLTGVTLASVVAADFHFL